MSHYPNPLFLVPASLATAFYTSIGSQAIRILTIGLITDYFLQQTAIVIIFTAAAISSTISQASTTLFSKFDFFSLFGVIQSLIFYLSVCQLCFIKNTKKPSVNAYFLCCTMLSLSVSLSVAYISIFFFGVSALIFVAISLAIGPLTFEFLSMQHQEFYDNEQFAAGFGVEHNKDGMQLQHGTSFFNTIKKRFAISLVVFCIIMTIGLPLVLNFFGNYHKGLFGYLFLVVTSCVSLIISVLILWLIKSNKQLRKFFKDEEDVLPNQQQNVGGETKEKQDIEETTAQKIKKELKQFKDIDRRDFIWFFCLLIIYEGINLFFYGKKQHIFYFISPIIFSFFSMKCLLTNSTTSNVMFMIIMTPLTINQPLITFAHYFINTMLNAAESLPYSTLLLYAAQSACICFSQQKHKWIFSLVFVALAIPSQIPILERSNLGVQAIIFMQSFAIDVLISLPRRYVKNIIVNGLVLISIIVYSQKYMTTAVGQRQSNITVFSIVLRVITNTINSFLFIENTNQSQMAILKIVIQWNGYFSTALSLLIQILSYFNLGDRVSNLKYIFLVPLFAVIAAVIAFTPLNIIIVDLILFVTGFANIFTLQSSHVLQEITILVYQAFYLNVNAEKQLSLKVLIYICRALAGIFIGAFSAMVINLGQEKKQYEKFNIFLQLLFSSFLCLFIAVPSAIAQLGEIEEFPFTNNVIILLIFVFINFIHFIEIDNFGIKVLFGICYVILLLCNLLSNQYSESTILLVFQMLLAFLPQNFFVVSYIVNIILLIVVINVKYALVTITYQSAISTFSLMSVLFLARFVMVKHSAIRRIAKKMKISNVGCKINSKAFQVGEEDLDLFLGFGQEQTTPQQNYDLTSENVYNSLKWQMYAFIFISSLVLSAWNFYPFVNVVLSLCTLLIPVDQRDNEDKITQIAGYIGVLDGYLLNAQNKQQMITRFVFTLYSLFNIKFVFDLIAFVSFYFSEDFYKQSVMLVIKDIILYMIQFPLSFVGYVYITGTPSKLFEKLINLQKNKILVILTIISIFCSVFATNQVLKLLPAFLVCAIAYTAPQLQKQNIKVESVEI